MEEIKIPPMDGKIHLDAQKEVTEVSPEQWKDGGDCDACRRQPYCGTPCKAKKIRIARKIQAERDALMQEMIMDMKTFVDTMKDAKEVEESGEEGTAADECTEA